MKNRTVAQEFTFDSPTYSANINAVPIKVVRVGDQAIEDSINESSIFYCGNRV